MTLALQNSGSNFATSGNSISATYYPASGTILVAIIKFPTNTGFRNVSSVIGGGVTWQLRKRAQDAAGGYYLSTEIWWAYLPTTPGPVTVTANLSGGIESGFGAALTLLAVSGVQKTSNPWDGNSTFPDDSAHFGTSQQIQTNSGLTTSSNSAFIFSAEMDMQGGTAAPSVGTGMHGVDSYTTGSLFDAVTGYKIVTSAGAQSVPWNGNEFYWQVITDAITGDAAAGATGTITTALSGISQSAQGLAPITGDISMSLRGVSQLASGGIPPVGTITTALKGISQSSTGLWEFAATAKTTLPAFSQSLAGEVIVNKIVQNFFGISQSASAKEIFTGTITTRLGGSGSSALGVVVEAEEIIQGPIVMHLSGIRSSLLGAQLGQPGAGKWRTWRETV